MENNFNFVAVDLGASETRYASDKEEIKILRNNMVFLEPNAYVGDYESENLMDVLDITIKADCKGNYVKYPVRAVIGKAAERWFKTNERPSINQNKHVQRINYTSAVVASALEILFTTEGEAANKTAVENAIDLFMAIPPMEISMMSKQEVLRIVKENLVGNYNLTFNKFIRDGAPLQLNFTIKDVYLHEESVLSILSHIFKTNGEMRPGVEEYKNSKMLSLDIGASTTDLAIVENFIYKDKTGQTFKTGGNVARSILQDFLRAHYGQDFPDVETDRIMREGRIQNGRSFDDCSSFVQRAKEEFAKQVVNQIESYFRKIDIPVQLINPIIVSGGGSMESGYIDENGTYVKTVGAIGEFILEPLKHLCPNLEVLQLEGNARLGNIKGLVTVARLKMKKKQISLRKALDNAQDGVVYENQE